MNIIVCVFFFHQTDEGTVHKCSYLWKFIVVVANSW